MSQNEVIELMLSSNNEREWNQNCDKVKKACNGYPDFWYRAIIMGGILSLTQAGWKEVAKHAFGE